MIRQNSITVLLLWLILTSYGALILWYPLQRVDNYRHILVPLWITVISAILLLYSAFALLSILKDHLKWRVRFFWFNVLIFITGILPYSWVCLLEVRGPHYQDAWLFVGLGAAYIAGLILFSRNVHR